MTPVEFQTEMRRLSSTFGANFYTTERTALIWREVDALPSGTFARVIDRLIGEQRQPPLLPEIREAVARERERLRSLSPAAEAPRPWELPHECTYCFDGGVFFAEKKGGDPSGPSAFRCACKAGQASFRTQFPFFTSAHAKEFVLSDLRSRAALVLAAMPGKDERE